MATRQKTKGIKHHPILSDSDRGGLVLDTFGICLWREQGRRAAPREKSVGRCARKRGVEGRGRYWQLVGQLLRYAGELRSQPPANLTLTGASPPAGSFFPPRRQGPRGGGQGAGVDVELRDFV